MVMYIKYTVCVSNEVHIHHASQLPHLRGVRCSTTSTNRSRQELINTTWVDSKSSKYSNIVSVYQVSYGSSALQFVEITKTYFQNDTPRHQLLEIPNRKVLNELLHELLHLNLAQEALLNRIKPKAWTSTCKPTSKPRLDCKYFTCKSKKTFTLNNNQY